MELLILLLLAAIWFFARRAPPTADRDARVGSTAHQTGDALGEGDEVVIADIETTGLDETKHEIIEIAAIRVGSDFQRRASFSTLVQPTRKVPKKITEITGISDEAVRKNGVTLANALDQFLVFVGNRHLVFYNSDFDMKFLDEAAYKADRRLDNSVSCALEMARDAFPGLKNYKLATVAAALGGKTDGAHRALDDCEMTLKVYTEAASKLEYY